MISAAVKLDIFFVDLKCRASSSSSSSSAAPTTAAAAQFYDLAIHLLSQTDCMGPDRISCPHCHCSHLMLLPLPYMQPFPNWVKRETRTKEERETDVFKQFEAHCSSLFAF
jgi:hypothetical protein